MKKKTAEEFKIQFENLVGNEYTLLEDYKTAITKIRVRHNICNKEYEVTPNKFLNGRRCPYCKSKRISKSEMLKYLQVKETINEVSDGEFQICGGFNGTSKYITVKCSNCGKEKRIIYNNFIERFSHCTCHNEHYFNQLRQEKELELVKMCENNGYKLMSEYKTSIEKVKIKHLKCGTVWEISPSNFKNGYGCPKCNRSKGEERIEKYLLDNNIQYCPEKKFSDCIDIGVLRFDFYLPDYNLAIEYQGRQHYEVVEIFGGEEEFKDRQRRDNIKRKYCNNNKINLLEIKYCDFDNIEELIYYKILKIQRKEEILIEI